MLRISRFCLISCNIQASLCFGCSTCWMSGGLNWLHFQLQVLRPGFSHTYSTKHLAAAGKVIQLYYRNNARHLYASVFTMGAHMLKILSSHNYFSSKNKKNRFWWEFPESTWISVSSMEPFRKVFNCVKSTCDEVFWCLKDVSIQSQIWFFTYRYIYIKISIEIL